MRTGWRGGRWGVGVLLVLGGVGGCLMASGPRTTAVAMTAENAFSPADMTVTAGDTITWTNTSTAPHTVTADPLNALTGGPNSDRQFPTGIPGGQVFRWTVPATAPGGTVWYYHCRFHGVAGNGRQRGPGMTGAITVRLTGGTGY